MNTFTIELPAHMMNTHFKCLGHFVTDHLLMLFKFKMHLQTQQIYITKLNIICQSLKSFMLDLYKAIFDQVQINQDPHGTLNLQVVLGSIKEDQLIYLAKSDQILPEFLYENARKISEHNAYYAKLFKEFMLNKFNITPKFDKDVLIINRNNPQNTSGRCWVNLEALTTLLTDQQLSFDILAMEEYTIKQQMQIVNSYKYIITAGNSSFLGHYFWIQDATIIECCIKGLRCINTIIFAQNLDLQLYILTTKLKYKSADNHILNQILEYQYENDFLLDSKNIDEQTIHNEITFYNKIGRAHV